MKLQIFLMIISSFVLAFFLGFILCYILAKVTSKPTRKREDLEDYKLAASYYHAKIDNLKVSPKIPDFDIGNEK